MEHIAKFRISVRKEEDGCWHWIGRLDKHGLPIIRTVVDGKIVETYPRRLSLQLAEKHPHKSEQVQPLVCNNKLCVNPEHLIFGDESRFWSKVQKLGEDDCWIWTASQDKDMYGKFRLCENGKKIDIRAHQYAWILFSGKPIPTGVHVCHHCDKPYCVNPSHLFLGTTQDNTQDRHEKGRDAKGAKNGSVKLTEEQVREIRELHSSGKYTKVQLSKLYGVSAWTIGSIILRQTWTHIV